MGPASQDSCFWLDIGGGQAVNRVVTAGADDFSDCLADHTGDESSMYGCLMDGLEVQVRKNKPPAQGFPAWG